MSKTVNLFTGSTGLNNKVDPVRLKFDPETGMSELSEAVNTEIESSGRIGRQSGYNELVSGSFKSLCPFDCGGYSLVLQNGSQLMAVDHIGTLTGVRSSMTDAYIDYELVSDGKQNWTYYLNGHERGRVYNMVSYEWIALDYVGPDTTKQFSDPPNGHLLTLYNGRMYIAMDNVIYASEPHDFGKFLMEENYIPFPGEITLLEHMRDGIFVSDDYSVYSLLGGDILRLDDSFALNKVGDKPIIRGTGVRCMAENIGMDFSGEVILAWTDFGCMVLGPGGYYKNHTFNKLIRRVPAEGTNYLPDSSYGASLVMNNEQLISTFI